MAPVSLFGLSQFFSDSSRCIKRGENAVKSNHIVRVNADWESAMLMGAVQSSQKERSYNVTVKSKATDRGAANLKPISEWYQRSKPEYRATEPPEAKDLEEARLSLTKLGLNTPFEWLHSAEPEVTKLPALTFDDVVLTEAFFKLPSTQEKKSHVIEKLSLTERQIGLLAELTKSQRLSPYWYMFRKGRLTASNFGKVIAADRRNSFPPSLFKSLMGEYNLEGAKSVQWGIAHEQDAVDSYKNHPICPSTEIIESGLYLESSGILGASPDRLIGTMGLLEIKCPYSYRLTGAMSGVGKAGFPIQREESGTLYLNKDHSYYHQIQGQLYITARATCILYIWTPKDCIAVPVPKDAAWGPYLNVLKRFYCNHLLPKLLSGSA